MSNSGIGSPICPVCGMGFNWTSNPSMHEVFFTRGHVQGLDFSKQLMIHTGENIVLLHEIDPLHRSACHDLAQHQEEYKILCAKSLLEIYGYDLLEMYIESVEEHTKVRAHYQRQLLEKAVMLWTSCSG